MPPEPVQTQSAVGSAVLVRLRLLAYGLAAAVFVLDRITKVLVRHRMGTWETLTVIPGFFNIVHAENAGAAFSLFASAHSQWRTLLLIGVSSVALVVIGLLLWRPSGHLGDSLWLRFALALIMGGALGNVHDRVTTGTVTDFLQFYVGGYYWPSFNVADSAITVGAALVLLDMLRPRRAARKTDVSGTVSNR